MVCDGIVCNFSEIGSVRWLLCMMLVMGCF